MMGIRHLILDYAFSFQRPPRHSANAWGVYERRSTRFHSAGQADR